MVNMSQSQGQQTSYGIPSVTRQISFPAGSYQEPFDKSGKLIDDWFRLFSELDRSGIKRLQARQARATRTRIEDGAAFNPFSDQHNHTPPWALDSIPALISAPDWNMISAGVAQRAKLLERVLSDVYGNQEFFRSGQLPAELLFANPAFLRTSHGTKPTGDRHLLFYAVDIYRHTDGRFRVWQDFASNPTGLGYALENRLVNSRVFTDFYHRSQVHRLAPFFQKFHQSLTQRVAARSEDPDIVLLSPGPNSPIYFEHALLSRYMGYPLVESQDLTIRGSEVFLKKLIGLEPVHTILRYIDDQLSDPFTNTQNSSLGIAGLTQAIREQTVDVVNPLGTGFINTPLLGAYLPELSRNIDQADLILDTHPTFWCGKEENRRRVLENPEAFDVYGAFDQYRRQISTEKIQEQITQEPHAYLLSDPLTPSSVPSLFYHQINSRYTVYRIFACASENGFEIMPGGLAIISDDLKKLREGNPETLLSKDLWAISDQPVSAISLKAALRTPKEFTRSSDLPSRVADHLLWLGRYLERAEGRVRLLRTVFRRLTGENQLKDIPDLIYLLKLLKAQEVLPTNPDDSSEIIPKYHEFYSQLESSLYDINKVESVTWIIDQIQRTAGQVRDWFSIDSWRVINRLNRLLSDTEEDPIELMDDILLYLSSFSGMTMESITRGYGWRFLDIGRRIERAINLTQLIATSCQSPFTLSKTDLEALLEITASIMTYRNRYRTTFQIPPVLDLLLVDETNPKSLAFQCSMLANHIDHLPRENSRRFSSIEERLTLEMLTGVRLLELTDQSIKSRSLNTKNLTSFLKETEERLLSLGQEISQHYLTRTQTTPHYSSLTGEHKV